MEAHTKASLLALLAEQGVETKTYEHPKVLTVNEQAKYVGHLEGGHSKNLLLKDKKNRLILISALTTTTVDMKVLSQRLGLGKGGVRLAPEDAIQSVLKLPLGCVTPFALLNESASSVTLLLDQGFKAKSQLYFHPLSNDATSAISPSGLDKFLRSLGRQPAYVDLQEVVVVGKDQKPDLAVYLLGGTTKNVEKETVPDSETTPNRPSQPKPAAYQGITKGSKVTQTSASDVQAITTSILDELVSAVHSEVGSFKEEVKDVNSGGLRQRLAPELERILMALKNTAYSEGFGAGVASRSLAR